jgi:hypothetical protein
VVRGQQRHYMMDVWIWYIVARVAAADQVQVNEGVVEVAGGQHRILWEWYKGIGRQQWPGRLVVLIRYFVVHGWLLRSKYSYKRVQ